jgi:hypothetical protein
MTAHHPRPIAQAGAIALLAVCVALLLPAGASAATATTPNACQLSYDGSYREQTGTVTADAAILGGGASVTPGQTVRQEAGSFDLEFPDGLIRDAYGAGFLREGANTIEATAWIVLEATNTAEGTKLFGPYTIEATTTVTAGSPNDGSPYQSHTPLQYTRPPLEQTDWTAAGGDVRIAQAPAGAFEEPLPLGPELNGAPAPRQPGGSLVLRYEFPDASGSPSIYADCQPGTSTGDEIDDDQGPEVAPGTATPFASFDGPLNVSCISEAGEPAREIEFATLALSASGFAPTYDSGASYTLTGARIAGTIPEEVVDTLDGAAGESRPYSLWATIAATGTSQPQQTVRIDSTYTAGSPLAFDLPLPPTTWTPSGNDPLVFRVAGQTPGAVDGGYVPYGSLTLRFGPAGAAQTLDCVRGAVAVTGSAPYSPLGREGSAGRYTIRPNATNPVLASATSTTPQDKPGDTPTDTPRVTPDPRVDPPPPPRPNPRGLGGIVSKRMTAKGRVARVVLACARVRRRCDGTIKVRTVTKIGKQRRAVDVGRAIRYSLRGGDRVSVRFDLSRPLRRALRRDAIRVAVTLTGKGGSKSTKRMTLAAAS